MTFVTTLIEEIRSARAQVHVPVGLKVDLVPRNRFLPPPAPLWKRNEALITPCPRSTVSANPLQPPKARSIAVAGGAFAIPLEGLIDIAEEKARLTKTMDKLAKEIGGLKGRLNNPNFAASAPEDVVMEARSNLEAREDEAAKLQAALKRLAELG